MLGSIQRVMVQEQVAECTDEQAHCRDCGQMLVRKGQPSRSVARLTDRAEVCGADVLRFDREHLQRNSTLSLQNIPKVL
jgi:hypothetical protein